MLAYQKLLQQQYHKFITNFSHPTGAPKCQHRVMAHRRPIKNVTT